MSDSAEKRDTVLTAAEAVKTYVRMHRDTLARDGELLSLLVPGRFEGEGVHDLQRYALERLSAENAALRIERDSLRAARDHKGRLNDTVRRSALDLIGAKSFAEAITVGLCAGEGFGAEHTAICIESPEGGRAASTEGVQLIPAGTVRAVLGRDASGAILSGGGQMLLGRRGAGSKSLAVFRLRLGLDAPEALFVLGARDAGFFEGAETEDNLRYLARALERAIRTWLDLPKI